MYLKSDIHVWFINTFLLIGLTLASAQQWLFAKTFCCWCPEKLRAKLAWRGRLLESGLAMVLRQTGNDNSIQRHSGYVKNWNEKRSPLKSTQELGETVKSRIKKKDGTHCYNLVLKTALSGYPASHILNTITTHNELIVSRASMHGHANNHFPKFSHHFGLHSVRTC